jgi:hypothetical protein
VDIDDLYIFAHSWLKPGYFVNFADFAELALEWGI